MQFDVLFLILNLFSTQFVACIKHFLNKPNPKKWNLQKIMRFIGAIHVYYTQKFSKQRCFTKKCQNSQRMSGLKQIELSHIVNNHIDSIEVRFDIMSNFNNLLVNRERIS